MNVTCPHCNGSLEADSSVVGTTVRCPVCNNNFVVGGAVKPKGVVQNNNNIPNYLVPAILVTLFCCIPFGIVSLINSSNVNTKLAQGDISGAINASKKAKLWIFISLGAGLLGGILYIMLNILVGLAEA